MIVFGDVLMHFGAPIFSGELRLQVALGGALILDEPMSAVRPIIMDEPFDRTIEGVHRRLIPDGWV